MSKVSKRSMTLNERLYTVGESISQAFTLQFLVKGRGRIDAQDLQNSLEKLAEKLPALRLRLKGHKWHFDGKTPELIVHESDPPQDWNDPLFRAQLDAKSGKCSEIHLFQDENSSILFRVLHSAMDAKGAKVVLQNLFALLRGEAANPDEKFSSDIEIRKALQKKNAAKHSDYGFKWPAFAIKSENKYQTVCISLNHRLEAPLAKIASWYAQKLKQNCRILVPVDLRRHDQVPQSASNLSLPIYLDVSPEQSWQEIQAKLLSALSEKEELMDEKFEALALKIPMLFLRKMFQLGIRKAKRTGLFPMSGILSNNGYIELSSFSTPSFIASSVISLPVFVPLAPFCVNVIEHKQQTNIVFNVPFGMDILSLKNRLEKYLKAELPKSDELEISASELDTKDLQALKTLWAEILECPETSIRPEVKFHDLGGDSLKLLAMLSELASDFDLQPQSSFLNAVLNTGGDINIKDLLIIINQYRSVHPKR